MSSGFITEAELEERRRARQEEWEKARQPDQPLEAPEEEYDHRTLFERLQAQKQKRDLEYEEAHRLKNMIKGLDDDEVEFLDLVDRSKLEEERKKTIEEAREMAEFRSKVACLQEESLAERIQQEIRKPSTLKNSLSSGKSSQSKLLAGAVVKKRSTDSPNDGPSSAKRLKESTNSEESKEESKPDVPQTNSVKTQPEKKSSNKISLKPLKVGGMTCIGVLPGLGHYGRESSDEVDSDESTDFEEYNGLSKFDLVGRKIKKKKECLGD